MKITRIYSVGVGGQGNVLASKLLGEAALASGIPVVLSETHGMAQRGGVVESTTVLGGAESPIISDGCADVLLSFEPMEAVRALRRANASTVVVTNTSPLVPFIPGGKEAATYPDVAALLNYIRSKGVTLLALDARAEALAAGNALGLNMVMLGALLGTGVLSISKDAQISAIRNGSKPAFLAANLDCFERGFKAAAQLGG